MQDVLFRFVTLLLLVGLVSSMSWVTFKALINGGLKGGLKRAVAGHDGFALDEEFEDEVSFRAAATPTRPAIVVRERSSTNSRGYTSREWTVSVLGLDALTTRTNILVGLGGFSGVFRNRSAIKDIKIGERRFDRSFKIGGRDEDVIRGVFAHEEVRAAVRALFKGLTILHCAVDNGRLVVEFLPDHVRGHTGRARIARVVRLAEAFKSASTALALNAPALATGSAPSSSGAPLGVRIL